MVSRTSAADSHPIHLHQIKFEVVKRCLSNEVATCSPGDDVLGSEKGWKDAVIAYPYVYPPDTFVSEEGDICNGCPDVCPDTCVDIAGEPVEDDNGPIGRSTFIRMKFDLLGIYGEPSSLQHMLCIWLSFYILLFLTHCLLPQFGIATFSLMKIMR